MHNFRQLLLRNSSISVGKITYLIHSEMLYLLGWESQILETGFLATFLCPIWSFRPVPKDTPTSKIVIWGFIWLIFRIMIGAVSSYKCSYYG